MVNQPLYTSIQETVPEIARYRAQQGREDLRRLPVLDHVKKSFDGVFKVPLFRRQFCKMLVEEINHMKKEIPFEPNSEEDVLRQIPEIVLREHVPELYRSMWFVVQNVLN